MSSPTPLVLLRAINYSGSGTWNDESPFAHNATIENGIALKNKAGNGILLNGSTNWTFSNVGLGNTWTASVWFKSVASPTWSGGSSIGEACILTQIFNDSSRKTSMAIAKTTDGFGKLQTVAINGTGLYSTGVAVADNAWFNYTSIWDGSSVKVYINGALVSTDTSSFVTADGGLAWRIGRRWDSAEYVTGEIGEVRIYNTALTAGQVTTLYNNSSDIYLAPSPLILLRGIDYTSGAWLDKSGYTRNATLEAGVSAKNTAGNGLVLNGSTSWTFPNIFLANKWTGSFWFKPLSLSSWPSASCILTQIFDAGPRTASFSIGNSYGTTQLSTIIWSNNAGESNKITIAEGSWLNYQVTWDGTTLKTYLNNSLVDSVTRTVASVDSKLAWRIGRLWDSASYINGEIGEVRVYGTPLTAAQVSADYYAGLNTFAATAVAPTAITAVSFPLLESTKFVASWTGGYGATSYTYTLNGNPVTPVDNGVGGQSASFTGLVANTSYSLVITATNSVGSVSSAAFSVGTTVTVTVPMTPDFLVAGGQGGNKISYSNDGLIWAAATNPLDGEVRAVAYNGSMWVAGGYNVNATVSIATSTDGINWTGRSTPLNGGNPYGGVYGVAWGGSLWVAVGNGGAGSMMTSPDGITWTIANTNPFTGGAGYGVAWNGWRWVAVGANTGSTISILTSDDGINWTPRTTPFTGGYVKGVAWNGFFWVAVGSGSGKSIATSYDGVTWVARTNPLSSTTGTGYANGIAWNGSLWVAVGQTSDSTVTIVSSPDGITWTAANNPFPGGLGNGIAWNGSLWVAVGRNATNTTTIATSPDALTWTARTNPVSGQGQAVAARRLIYTPLTLPITDAFSVAVGSGDNTLVHSYDGSTWISRTNPLNAEARAVVWNGSMWVAGGYNVNATVSIATSTDGINWTGRSTPLNGGNPYGGVYGLAWSGSLWVAVGFGGTTIMSSPDAITWTAANNNPFGAGGAGQGVAWNGSMWVAVGSNGDSSVRIATSTDGINWTPRTNPFTAGIVFNVAWNGFMWVAVGIGAGNTIATSTDGITWTARTNPLTEGARGIAWNGSAWMASGSNSNRTITHATSPDGITWTASGNAFPGGLANGICWNGSLWLTVGYNSDVSQSIATSPDGITWTSRADMFNTGNDVASRIVRILTRPSKPTDLSSTVTSTSFAVSWTPVSYATSYTYLLNGASVTPNDNGLSNQSATFTGLSPSTTYTCVVIANNVNGTTSSDALSVTTAQAPPAPTPVAVTELASSLTNANISTPTAATSAITSALATTSVATVVSAALSVDSPALFTALVNNPLLVGATVAVPSAVAAALYDSASNTSIDRSLPLVVTIPAADGSVPAPVVGNNTRMAIDVSVPDFTPFAGATGYGVRVVNGVQYFVSPGSPDVAITVGRLMSFVTNTGATRDFTVADLDLLLIPYNTTTVAVSQLATSLTNANITTPSAATSAITEALVTSSAAAVVSAALSLESPALLTALVNNPALVGATVTIPPAAASVLYDTANNTNIDRSLPLVVSIPAADGSVVAPVPVNNTRMAIDVSVSDFTPFADATGYGVRVVNGVQYFVSPGNADVPITLGRLMSFVTNSGATREFTIADVDLFLIPYTTSAIAITQLASSLTNANISTPSAATSAIADALVANSAAAVVSAALSVRSPALLTALVNNPALAGATVTVPSALTSVLYDSANNTNINRSLPLVVSIPANGSVPAPVSGRNTRLAIDVSVQGFTAFAGTTGYGISVVNGVQYFVSPGHANTAIAVGSVMTIVTGGVTLNFTVADLNLLLVPYNGPPIVCFLGSAPVLTPSGYRRIDRMQLGDIVVTPTGTAKVEAIKKQSYKPTSFSNPYVIPEGKFGANRKLLISPRHKVLVDGKMVEARDLGLEQEEQKGTIIYYNLQITKGQNMIVAGVEVESLAPLVNMTISYERFNSILATQYGGKLTDEIKSKCRFLPGGVVVPVIRR